MHLSLFNLNNFTNNYFWKILNLLSSVSFPLKSKDPKKMQQKSDYRAKIDFLGGESPVLYFSILHISSLSTSCFM